MPFTQLGKFVYICANSQWISFTLGVWLQYIDAINMYNGGPMVATGYVMSGSDPRRTHNTDSDGRPITESD